MARATAVAAVARHPVDLATGFARYHRRGSGPPLVLLHGFTDTWRTWELILPALEHRHDVLALTLPGHAGGAPLHGPDYGEEVLSGIERAMDEAGWPLAHVAGNSLGGYLALRLAERGRARTVTAFAPGGGWGHDDDSWRKLLRWQAEMKRQMGDLAPNAERFLAMPGGPRAATELMTVSFEHIPAALLAHQMRGIAACAGAEVLIEHALATGWALDAARITCPVRIVWGTADRLLPWPVSAARYRGEWLPQADWVLLDDVGHCPQLDVPVEAAQLILGWTGA